MTTFYKSGKPRVYEMLEEPSGDYIDVVEKSAYDRLEACCEKLAGFLKDAQCECTVVERESGHLVGCWRPEVDEALAEYRAMRDETKMPCPRND